MATDFSTTTVIGSADSILSSEKSDTNVELKTIEELFLANEVKNIYMIQNNFLSNAAYFEYINFML